MSLLNPSLVDHFGTEAARIFDIDALVELRKNLLSQGDRYYVATSFDTDQAWQKSYRAWLHHHLLDGSPHIRIMVTRDSSTRVVACATGIIDDRAPAVGSLDGRAGWVQSVVVEHGLRKRGLARQTMLHLLRWFDEQDVHQIALQTTPDALSLYESLGFERSGEDLLIRLSN